MNLLIFLFILNNNIYLNFNQITRSNIHAIYTFFVSLMYLYDFSYIKEYYLQLVYFSLFYCVYDISYLLDSKINGYKSLIIHHSLIIYAICYSNYYYYSNDKIISLIALNYLTEISTPFFNCSFEMVRQKRENTLEYKLVNTLVVLSFGISRIGLIPHLIKSCLDYHITVIFCQVLLSSMNVIWFYKICKYYKKIINNEIKIKKIS